MALSSVKGFFCLLLITCMIGMNTSAELSEKFYEKTCPKAVRTIRKAVQDAVKNERRMGASLLRLHFHDCFVQGCDASALLDDTSNFTGEKNAFPNANSLRGFELIDNIKSRLEDMCPNTVSCSDILTLAARDGVAELGGQRWTVLLGRRDSTTANLSEANTLPAPFLNLDGLITTFAKKGFTAEEMVTLSGAHTIGLVRCRFFRARIYNETNIDPAFAAKMQAECPFEGGDDNFSPFDSSTPRPHDFDNGFYQNLLKSKGLIHSDQQLFGNGSSTNAQVRKYSRSMGSFKKDFADAMFKMTMLSPLTGTEGEIRTNCHFVNAPSNTTTA